MQNLWQKGCYALFGGGGNDTYTVNGGTNTIEDLVSGDVIITTAGTVSATLTGAFNATAASSFAANTVTLNTGAFAADLSLVTTAGATVNTTAGTIIGTGFADRITVISGSVASSLVGGADADTITGGGGADTITGGTGIDVLTGGDGADRFVFNTVVLAANANNISDFTTGAGGDVLQFDAATFTNYAAGQAVTFLTLAQANTLDTADVAGSAARAVIVDTAANIIQVDFSAGNAENIGAMLAIATDTGEIYYDADGDFTGGTEVIGDIGTNITGLIAADFVIV